MSSPFSAAQLAAITNAVKELFAAMFIGFCISTTLYGISVLQVYLYFRRYTKDRWALKTTVATLWTLDTLTTIFVAHSFFVFVLGILNLKNDIDIPWSFTAEKLLVTIITFISQCFYAQAIWKVSQKKATTAFITFLTVSSFSLGIYTTVHLFQNPALTSISTRGFLIISGLVQGLAALNDIVITGAFSYYLHVNRTGLPSSEKLIDTLIVYAVSRGVLTAIAQIMFLVLNVALPHRQFWLPFHMVVGKLYVNSVLTTLNVRQTLSQSEIQFGPGMSFLGKDIAEMNEQNQIITKPTSALVPNPSTFGSVRRGSGIADVEE
ncbi:hypothetical protein B0H17DRAFT_1332087 [Mycena rosella]|uniref:DUF6534 domain-containing protein n=1 Tax=Mycena rosella TaxID=1033263 RepID=A0AAD7DCZ6_MYCRO|nr:hypothetical protein B0H17DRAFT_1332087 [Mycena rosella]